MDCVANGLAFSSGILISCGPSQLYGVIKGSLDLVKLAKIQYKISEIGTGNAQASAKIVKYHSRLNDKVKDLKADCLAFIPFAGALVSWQVFAEGSTAVSLESFFESVVPQLAGNHSKSIARKIFYPLAGKSDIRLWVDDRKMRIPAENINEWIEPEEIIKIPVFDTSGFRNLDARYKRHEVAIARDTVVVFHANAMTSDNMKEWGDFYFHQGYDVLLPTIGGYPGSDAVNVCEASTYRDVEGIRHFLQNQGVTRAGYHGLSIGGSLALQAAVGATTATKVLTTFVVADQTFNTGAGIAGNFICNKGFGFLLPFAKGTARAALPSGHRIFLDEETETVTDGLDNVRKARLLKEKNIPLLVIESDQDVFMTREKDGAIDNLADDLLAARYDSVENGIHRKITLSGEHCSFFGDDELASNELKKFARWFMPYQITPNDVNDELASRLSAILGITNK